jgi:hypothetical protein
LNLKAGNEELSNQLSLNPLQDEILSLEESNRELENNLKK